MLVGPHYVHALDTTLHIQLDTTLCIVWTLLCTYFVHWLETPLDSAARLYTSYTCLQAGDPGSLACFHQGQVGSTDGSFPTVSDSPCWLAPTLYMH